MFFYLLCLPVCNLCRVNCVTMCMCVCILLCSVPIARKQEVLAACDVLRDRAPQLWTGVVVKAMCDVLTKRSQLQQGPPYHGSPSDSPPQQQRYQEYVAMSLAGSRSSGGSTRDVEAV